MDLQDQRSLVVAAGIAVIAIAVVVAMGSTLRTMLSDSLRAYFSGLLRRVYWLAFAVVQPFATAFNEWIQPHTRLSPVTIPNEWYWGLVMGGFAIASFLTYHDLREQTGAGHPDAPKLNWAYPRAEMRANGSILVEVQCENAGPAASVAITGETAAWSSLAGEAFQMPITAWSIIRSSELGQTTHVLGSRESSSFIWTSTPTTLT